MRRMRIEMGHSMSTTGTSIPQRVDWVDYAKGFCIVFVVMMHSTLGVGQATGQEGWLHTVVAFAKPFRMPDFFVVTKLAHSLRVPAIVVWLAAAALEIAPIATGSTVIDEFASRFVYFYTGYLLAPRIFALAKYAQSRPETALAGLMAWGLI